MSDKVIAADVEVEFTEEELKTLKDLNCGYIIYDRTGKYLELQENFRNESKARRC